MLAEEARLQIMGAAALWLLAILALPAIVIANGLMITSAGLPVPWDRYAIVLGYDLGLVLALVFFFRTGMTRAAKILLAFLLLPAAVVGAITLKEQWAAETSTRSIR